VTQQNFFKYKKEETYSDLISHTLNQTITLIYQSDNRNLSEFNYLFCIQ